MKEIDVLIIGAGAAGLMCAIEAGKRNRQVVVLDHANKPGKKILMSGGGRCNFTNLQVSPEKYLSHNPHFCKSALSRYTQWDFIKLVEKYRIPYHEKTLGQLFCDNKAKDILNMLLSECEKSGAKIHLNESLSSVERLADNSYKVVSNQETYLCQSLVVACGGLSIPTMGATPLGYKIAAQFGVNLWPTRAGLVPITLHTETLKQTESLAGISNDVEVSSQKQRFRENLLFTHRGLSGPAILQISNYWHPGQEIRIDFLPDFDLIKLLKKAKSHHPKRSLKESLAPYITKRILGILLSPEMGLKPLQELSQADLEHIEQTCKAWILKPNGTEGYRTAEVTLGGVDCDALSSKTMETLAIKGLYFIGEVVDVTGWLGGYNFQWAWSSGWAAGQVV